MAEKSNFVMIGDERDIPMSLGLMVMAWNSCEITIRQILRHLGSKGNFEVSRAVEPLISELGSVSLTQALNCYTHELPEEEAALGAAIAHASQVVETCRAYRNYYIHNISGVTQYGIDFSYDTMEKDVPVHEAMMVGPFAKVYAKTAKGKQKFFMDFIKSEDLINFNNYVATLEEHLHELETAIIHYLRRLPVEERAALPQRLPLLNALKKPAFDHPKLKPRPALAPWEPIADDDEEEPEGA